MVDEIETTSQEQEHERTIPKSKQIVIWILTGIFVVVSLTILIVYKVRHPEFPFSTIIIVVVIILLVGLLIFFSNKIYSWIKKKTKEEVEEEDKVPKEKSMDEIEKELHLIVDKRMNHIKKPNGITPIKPVTIGKNSIYCFLITLLYKDIEYDDYKVYIIVNANYLKKKPAIVVPQTTKESSLRRLMNGLSTNPEQEPDTEITEEESPLTGVKRKTTRKTQSKKSTPKPQPVIGEMS